MLVHITIGYGQATIYVTTNQAGMTESVIVGTINVTTNNQAGMTESVIVGGCVRTLLFTITGLLQRDGICTCSTAEIEGCNHSHSCICNQN